MVTDMTDLKATPIVDKWECNARVTYFDKRGRRNTEFTVLPASIARTLERQLNAATEALLLVKARLYAKQRVMELNNDEQCALHDASEALRGLEEPK